MGPRLIAFRDPRIQISLQPVDRTIHLPAEGDTVELVKHGFMASFADPIGLRDLGFGARMINVLDREVELRLPQNSLPRSVSTRSNLTSCSSKKGSTRSLSRSAAVIGVFRSYSLAKPTLA